MLTLIPRRCLSTQQSHICAACTTTVLATSGPAPGRKALTTRSARARLAQKYSARQARCVSTTPQDAIDQLRKVLLADEQDATARLAKKRAREKKRPASSRTSSKSLNQSNVVNSTPDTKTSRKKKNAKGSTSPDSATSGDSTLAKRVESTHHQAPSSRAASPRGFRAELVSLIQDADRPLGERVEAMRTLRDSLAKIKVGSDKAARSEADNEFMAIKEAMMKEPSKKKPKESRPATRQVSARKGTPKTKSVRTGPMKIKAGFEINTVNAGDLQLVPLETPQPPVPKLSYGLERVLFNPGVYHLQDPRSRVFNFDPYLAKIMPVDEFDFNALKQYITSSRDETLLGYAKAEGKKYTGSTSSMTSALAHFHFLLSQWRPINTGTLSQNFPVPYSSFTGLQRGPASIFLRWKDGVYAIDGDKQYDTANILSMLGKSMEKLLTLSTEDFEKYRRENSDQITEKERNEAEAFNYTTIGDFLLRSQLDAHDPRLPGSGMFDLKTRAVVSIRMDAREYEQGMGYEIRGRHGEYESFEREYYDMIRAAFLKYSLQVRMGRMDGIFVAFHNTERIFGFQYISLSEMDYALHGTEDTTTGDSEFKLSLELLNRALDKATAKFPERSLRLHFETRNTETPFMYIFAEPLPDDEIQNIQDSNKAAVLEFERRILGLDAKTEEELLEERKSAEWQALRTKVEESMEKDEVNTEEARRFAEAMLEGSGSIMGQLTAEEKEQFMDEVIAGYEERMGRSAESSADEVVESEEGVAEDEDTGATATGDTEDDDDDDLESVDEDDAIDEDEEEEEGDAEERDEVEDEDEHDEHDEEEEEEEQSETDDVEQYEADRDVAENADGISGRLNISKTPESLVGDKAGAVEQIEPEAVENKQLLSEEPLPDDSKEGTQSADELTMSESFNAAKGGKTSTQSAGDVLAMTLTIRNKVNGKYTARPNHLMPQDRWAVEYALAEIAENRAESLYQATKRRRHAALSSDRSSDSTNPYNNAYIAKLKAIANKGRLWRNKIDKDEGPPKVLGPVYGPSTPTGTDKTGKEM